MINLTFAQQTVIRNGHDVQTRSPRIASNPNAPIPAPTVDASISAFLIVSLWYYFSRK